MERAKSYQSEFWYEGEDYRNCKERRGRYGRKRVVRRHRELRKTEQEIGKIEDSWKTGAEGQNCVWAERGSDKQG